MYRPTALWKLIAAAKIEVRNRVEATVATVSPAITNNIPGPISAATVPTRSGPW